jgi:hypothetical protein
MPRVGTAPVRWPHLALSSVLALGAVALAVGAVWIHRIPTLSCDEGLSPNTWIFLGFILFALGLPAIVIWGTLHLLHEDVHRYYAAAAIAESFISLALTLYLANKYGHYQCG